MLNCSLDLSVTSGSTQQSATQTQLSSPHCPLHSMARETAIATRAFIPLVTFFFFMQKKNKYKILREKENKAAEETKAGDGSQSCGQERSS